MGDEIIIRRSTIERTFFSIIIIVLAVLLVLCYFRGGTCSTDTTSQATGEESGTVASGADASSDQPNATAPVEQAPVETCSDALRNQDETDVDCGGTCNACAEGKHCALNSDCIKGTCKAGVCDATPELSGDLTLSLVKVDHEENDLSKSRVNAITVTIDNGMDENVDLILQVFIMDASGSLALNQPSADGDKPYAIVELPLLASGKSLKSQKYEMAGLYTGASWIYDLTDFYKDGDDYRVKIKAIDTGSGEVLATVSEKVLV